MGIEVDKVEYGEGPRYQQRTNQMRETKEEAKRPKKRSWDDLVEEISEQRKISSKELLEPSRKRERVEYCKELIIAAILHSDIKRIQIAK